MGFGEDGIKTTSLRQLEAPDQLSGVRNLNMTGQCIVSMGRIDSMMIQDRKDLIHRIIMGLVIHILILITNKVEEESLNDKTNMDIMITTKTSQEEEEIESWKIISEIEKEDMIITINGLIDIRWTGGDSQDTTNIRENIQGTMRHKEIATINGIIDIRWTGRDSLDTTNIPGTICHIEIVILDPTIILGVPVRGSLAVPQLIEVSPRRERKKDIHHTTESRGGQDGLSKLGCNSKDNQERDDPNRQSGQKATSSHQDERGQGEEIQSRDGNGSTDKQKGKDCGKQDIVAYEQHENSGDNGSKIVNNTPDSDNPSSCHNDSVNQDDETQTKEGKDSTDKQKGSSKNDDDPMTKNDHNTGSNINTTAQADQRIQDDEGDSRVAAYTR